MVCVHRTAIEQANHMQMYEGSNPLSIDNCKELIQALSCSLSDAKQMNIKKREKKVAYY